MKLEMYGKPDAPVIVMLPGSFCPGEALDYVRQPLQEEYRIITVTYNGHHEGSKAFGGRKQEAADILQELKSQGISHIAMVYGQSMGAEVGAELIGRLAEAGITYGCAFFDGAPMIRLSAAYKAFMRFKFGMLLRFIRTGSIDKILNMGIVKSIVSGDGDCLRETIIRMKPTAECISKESLRNVVECCYTFDFPLAGQPENSRWFFLYAKDEKACKTCLRNVKKAYGRAAFQLLEGYGHMTYSLRETEAYIALLRSWLAENDP